MGRASEAPGPWKRTQDAQNAGGETRSERLPVPDFRHPVFEMRQADRTSYPVDALFRTVFWRSTFGAKRAPSVGTAYGERRGPATASPHATQFPPAFS